MTRHELDGDGREGAVKVLVVDDDAFARASVVTLVERHVGQVAAASGTAADALARFRPGVAQVAILDLDLGIGPTGVDLAVQLRKRQPDLAIVFLSVVPDPRLIGVDPSLVPAGSVYFVKSDLVSGSDLREAVALALLRVAGARSPQRQVPRSALTDSQVELLRLLADGYSNKEIARRRVVSEAAVERSITRLVHRLDLPS
ncbi:MAG: response regulator, partial [Actinomycetes bacterium]